jgi:hypothetical protein
LEQVALESGLWKNLGKMSPEKMSGETDSTDAGMAYDF